MLTRFLDDLKATPERIANRQAELRRRARQRLHVVRGESETRIWKAQTNTLEQLGGLFEKASEKVPVISRVADAAEKLVKDQLQSVTTPEIENYDELNAKATVKALSDLGRVGLLRVQRHEQANKNRKTVLDAVFKQLEKLSEPVEKAA